MAIFRRRRDGGPLLPETADTTVVPRAITAAAMPMAGPGVKLADRARKQAANSDWQKQGWYYYDAIGELRSPLVWIANAVSQADIHATELDPATGTPTGPSENPTAMQAAAQVLGGAAKRATLLKVLALCWQVPGEAWVIVRPQGQGKPDEWIVLPPSQVKSKGNGADAKWEYRDPKLGVDIPLDAQSRLFRIWSPHPADFIQADSAVRPALPVCQEIERCSQTIAAQLNSRIALAPVMLLADELDFPRGDHETSAMALMDEVLAAAEASVQQPGTPAAIVPLGLNAPSELIASGGALAFISPTTEFVQGLDDLRDKALARLANTLDMPKDIAAGTQGESNHWSAWQVEESTYKIFIEPLLQALGDALTEQWFRPALVAMGMTEEQAATYEVGWDTTKIVARPDDTENLRDLHDRLLISDAYMLAENGIPDDAAPDQEEYTRRLLEKIVIGAPSLLSDPNVAQAMGLEVVVAPEATGASGEIEGGELEPEEPSRALPSTQGAEPEPEPVPDGLTAAVEPVVLRALELVGGKLLTRETRGQFAHVPKHELHVHVRPAPGAPGAVVAGTVRYYQGAAQIFGVDEDTLMRKLYTYVNALVASGTPYDRNDLAQALR